MKSRIIVLIVALVMATATMISIRFVKYRQRVDRLTIGAVDISAIRDGTYRGSYDLELVKVEVEVDIRGSRIAGIRILRHENSRGRKAESIVERVITEQKVNTDVVAGATASSKAILKAIERALTKNNAAAGPE